MNPTNYGFRFNHFEIKGNILKKCSKNEDGKHKLKREIQFYEYIRNHNIPFSIPNIYLLDKERGVIEMEYLDCTPLTSVFYKMKNPIPNILDPLSSLHKCSRNCSKEDYIENIRLETYTKIVNRYNETRWDDLALFRTIKTVNHIPFKTMDYYLERINDALMEMIHEKPDYSFCLIHGDIHLGNILVREKSQEFYFIDPRGYFGNQELFGIKEYDYAKLLFGISGYSVFDEMNVELSISEHNIDIRFIDQYCGIYESDLFDPFTKLLSLSIWLGNNSNFIDVNKKITSLMIAYYLCEKFIK